MPRTTVDIDLPVLREIKRLQKKLGVSMGRLISDLLARALSQEKNRGPRSRPFRWKPRPMGVPRVDLRDKDAVWALLDADRSNRTHE